MADYDVLYTLIVPILDDYMSLVGTTQVKIIEFNSDFDLFDKNLIPTGSDIMTLFSGDGYISIKPNQYFSDFLSNDDNADYLRIGIIGPSLSGVSFTCHFNGSDIISGSTITARDAYLMINTSNNMFRILYYSDRDREYYAVTVANLNTYDLEFSNWLDYTPKVVNFYADPSNYSCNNGDTVAPNFVLAYDDDNIIEGYTDITYESNYIKENISTVNGVNITVSENNTIKQLFYTARPNIEGTDFSVLIHIDVLDAKNPYFPDGNAPEGGNGKYDVFSDPTVGLIPSGSTEADASATGFYTRYLMSSTELGIFGDWLWTEDAGLAVAKSLVSVIYGDPSQSVISLVSYPFNISSLTGISSRSQNLYWGGFDSKISATALTSSTATIDWGTISIPEYWGSFLDYAPHTSIEMYLPWGTGFVNINPNECMNGSLSVITNIELNKGVCVHQVIANGVNVVATYNGSCGRMIPVTSTDYASKITQIASAAAAGIIVGGIGATAEHAQNTVMSPVYMTKGSTGESWRAGFVDVHYGRPGEVAGIAGAAALKAAAAMSIKPTHVSRSGSFSEGSASLTIQKPYIIISRPKQSVPDNYGHYYGYPSNKVSTLGSIGGYTEVGEIHLDGISATDEELNELDMILKRGVLL